jgi:hypothetical protein
VTANTPSVRRPVLPVWLIATIAGIAALLYAYVFWAALGFLIQQATGVEGLSGYGWFVLILPVVFPLAVFAGAFALGWRRSALHFALLLLTGLALVAVFWLDVFAYAGAADAIYNR